MRRTDVAVALGCAVAAFAASFLSSGWFEPFVAYESFDNTYFQTDAALVYSNMTERLANHYRTAMHPAFSLVFWPIVTVLRGLGLEAVSAVRLLLALNGAATGALCYVLLRLFGLLAFDAGLFALSFAGSVALLFFGTVPETFPFGGTTLLFVLLVAASSRPSFGRLLAANVASMSMTLTNWMAAIVTTFRAYPRDFRLHVRVFGLAVLIIAVCGVTTRKIFGSSGFTGDFREYVQWIRWPRFSDLRSFFVHSTVMPEPVYRPTTPGVLESTVEPVGIGAGSTLALVCALGWLVLLVAGAFALASRRPIRPHLRDVLAVTLLGQLSLHLCFSDGPFLFIGHFAPLLLLVAAPVRLLPLPKWPVRVAIAALFVAIAWNNLSAHEATVARFERDVMPWLEAHGVERLFITPEMLGHPGPP